MTRAMITGGAGFIGSHLVRRLLADGVHVHLVVQPNSVLHRLDGIAERVALYRLNLGDRAALDRAFAAARPDWIFHLAVKTRWRTLTGLADALGSIEHDLVPLLALLAAAERRPPAAFVRAGSLAEYGAGPVPFHETQREQPVTAYASGLVAGTHYTQMLGDRLPFPVVTPRLALTYGPGQARDFLVPALIDACLSRRPMHVRHPSERRDLIHVDDVVDALLLLAAAPPPSGTVVNISTGEAPTLSEVAALVRAATGVPADLVSFGPRDAHGPIPRLCGSPALARKLIGWSAHLSIAEGIHRTVEACRATGPHS